MADPAWPAIRDYLEAQLQRAYQELALATTVEALWRAQGKVQALMALQHLDQALVMTTKTPAS